MNVLSPVVRANGEDLIWLIVGLFWVIAQIAGAAAKKKRMLQPPSSGEGETQEAPPDPFSELLRKMGGAEEFRIEPPEFTEEEPGEKPWKPGEIEALPDIQPLRREPPVIEPAPQAQPVEITAASRQPEMSAFRATISSIKMPAFSLRPAALPQEKLAGKKKAGGIMPTLQTRQDLRHAMLHHIVFSPPKALQ